jgi:hypothetical protein
VTFGLDQVEWIHGLKRSSPYKGAGEGAERSRPQKGGGDLTIAPSALHRTGRGGSRCLLLCHRQVTTHDDELRTAVPGPCRLIFPESMGDCSPENTSSRRAAPFDAAPRQARRRDPATMRATPANAATPPAQGGIDCRWLAVTLTSPTSSTSRRELKLAPRRSTKAPSPRSRTPTMVSGRMDSFVKRVERRRTPPVTAGGRPTTPQCCHR